MKVTFRDAKILTDESGVWLCLKPEEAAPCRGFVLGRKDRRYDAEIREHRDRRSNDANAYYWELAGKLAQAIGQPPESVYREHIRNFGNYEVLCIQSQALEAFERQWVSGHLGRRVETRESKLPGCVTVLAYYGSSDFDKEQMSRLIDNIVQDCRAVGIETLPPDKLAGMMEAWGNAKADKGAGDPA